MKIKWPGDVKKLVITERRIRFYAGSMKERGDLEELLVNGRTIENVNIDNQLDATITVYY